MGLCAALLAAIGGCTTAQTEVLIEARPATVWKVISDAPGFERWNPVHVKVEGEFREGAQVRIHLKEPSGKVTVFDSTVRRMVPERELNQGGGTPGLFTFNHTFSLEPAGEGTRFRQREEFRGLGVIFFDLDWVEPSYQQVNLALKRRAEAMERGEEVE
jgi:hypothetical protein